MSKYDTLNEKQKAAVLTTEGPLLILAGAGSGKTRVITHRIAYLIEEKGVNPWNIMAITFTNKAAGEMRERVDSIVGYGSEHIWVSTFHSSCVKILRRFIDRIGYDNSFTIYDSDDSKGVMKEVCKKLNIDTKMIKEKTILGYISAAKNEMISAARFQKEATDVHSRKIAEAYVEYESHLKKNNALDFDDLLVKTVELFEKCPDVLDSYQSRFKYIMVDEYQDTNTVQFKLVSQLADKYRNLCVVGDDDQSIYKFRGANIQNILNFENQFEDATVIKLEQNYRSTANILNAANAVIKNNMGRKSKTLWTDKSEGEKIDFKIFENGIAEADYIARDIAKNVNEGNYTYNSNACLYRTNAQSRAIEERLVALNIPYRLVGGVNFYQRKEIKDVLAYLKTIDNAKDDMAVKRIINVPKRGIGNTSIDKIQQYADFGGLDFFEACMEVENIPGVNRAVTKVNEFTNVIRVSRGILADGSIKETVEYLLEQTGYINELKLENTDESKDRIENINELITKIVDYESGAENPTLSEFLEEVALVADIDSVDSESDYVVLMTVHSAKGLEFPNVYLSGMEEGIFPSYMSLNSEDPTDVEEERRLCYVAITRAMEKLHISVAKARMIRGETQYNKPSRFLGEIPPELLAKVSTEKKTSVNASSGFGRNTGFGSSDAPNYSAFAKSSEGSYKKTSFGNFGKPVSMLSSAFDKNKGVSAADIISAARNNKEVASGFGNTGGKSGFGTVSSYGATKPQGTASMGNDTNRGGSAGDSNDLGYDIGDNVKHMKFGEGTVIDISKGTRDYEVTVNFVNVGQKRMFASFAKLKKI